jgi:hypothetical protein
MEQPQAEITSLEFDRTVFDPTVFYDHIKNFVSDLSGEFGSKQHSLRLFDQLIKRLNAHPDPEAQSTIVHKFETFVRNNKAGIISKTVSKLSSHVIVFRGNVNIKLAEIFRLADEGTQTTIWAHLQCLLNVIDPDNKEIEEALQMYKETNSSSSSGLGTDTSSGDEVDENAKETQFIKSIISNIQPTIERNTVPGGGNPLGGIDLMGMFTQVTSMLDSQGSDSLDPEKLLTTVHKLSMRELKKVKGGH